MATRRKNPVLGPIRTLFNVGAMGHMTDGQLLERFATGGEAAELAFAALVERHGAVVLQTCRSILRDEHEAEDAFQATFLVLVRKSGSLWVRDSLSPWLHQVAYRAARSARSAAVRRLAHERGAAEMFAERTVGATTDGDDEAGKELMAALHEEIARLPERFRLAVVLCDLEGRTHEQAARHLGCPAGTVKSRLARGRGRLRERMRRRGLIVPAGIPNSGSLPRTTQAVPPASWAEATTRAAMQIAAGQSLAGAVAPRVLAVMRDISTGLVMKSLKGTMLAVLTLGAITAGAGGLAWAGLRGPTGDQEDLPPAQAARPAAVEEAPPNAEPEVRDAPDIRGGWDVLYVAGNVMGKREGYAMPNLIVQATDRTISLPILTGNSQFPLNNQGAITYTLHPGLTEQVELAQERLNQARTIWNNVVQTTRMRVLPEFTVSYARTKFHETEKALKDAERRREEGKAAGIREESRIELEAGPGVGKTLRGIYRLKGDTLTICYDGTDQGRPETFAADKPTENLVILRRGGFEQGLASVPSRVSEPVRGTKDTVGTPRLKLTIAGDKHQLTRDIANYTITAENPGTATAHDLRVVVTLPLEGRLVQPVPVDTHWDPSSGHLRWTVPQVEPGETVTLPILVRMGAPGFYTVSVAARGDDGLSGTSHCTTEVWGPNDAHLDLKILEQHGGTLSLNYSTNLTIRIKNIGYKDATKVRLSALLSKNILPGTANKTHDYISNMNASILPDSTRVEAVWNESQRLIVFPPIDRLAVGKELLLRLRVKAGSEGLGTCHAYLVHDEQTEALEDLASFKVTARR